MNERLNDLAFAFVVGVAFIFILLPLGTNSLCKPDEILRIGVCIREWVSSVGTIITPITIGYITIIIQSKQASEQKYTRRKHIIEKLRFEFESTERARTTLSKIEFFLDDIYNESLLLDDVEFEKTFEEFDSELGIIVKDSDDFVNHNINLDVKNSRKLLFGIIFRLRRAISDYQLNIIDNKSDIITARSDLISVFSENIKGISKILKKYMIYVILEKKKVESLFENDPL